MLNNKGIAISGILYAALILFMTLMLGILVMATSRKVLLDKEKIDILKELEGSEIISETSGFVCGEDLVDSRDTEEYETVQIGNQCWMAENLRYTGNGCTDKTWNDASPHDACQSHSTEWGEEVLYQWGAAMNGSTNEGAQGLCPDGWHVSTDNEWKILEMELGMSPEDADSEDLRGTNEGDKLKDQEADWCYSSTDCGKSGFNALPAGYRINDGSLNGVESNGNWWTSSPSGSNAWDRILYSGYSDVGRYDNSQADGRSVRCVLGQ